MLEKTIRVLKALLVFVAVLLGTYYLFELEKGVFNIYACPPCTSPSLGVHVSCGACLVSPLTAAYTLAQPVVSLFTAIIALVVYNNKVRRRKI